MSNPVVKFLYGFKGLRQLAKRAIKNKTIYQPFYNGTICFNAVEFNLFWLNDKTRESMDKEIQDKLLKLSQEHELFIDIGANIGIMTLSIALRNPGIRTIAYDPNDFVLGYLRKSVAKNKLTARVEIVNAAVSDKQGKAYMNFTIGPYSAHLSDKGTAVDVVDFNQLLKQFHDKKVLFKMDIEGFEKNLVSILVKDKNRNHTFVIEIHPKGLNQISEPEFVLTELLENNYTVTDVYGKKVTSMNDITDWSNVVCSYEN